ncbi:MAG TPA: substrate-binding domain-containing protein [Steroidobacteraceae bacterium]|nr:substrate-binding domain-containing protein [Steroidobacteraceae bacterium]
MPPSSIKLISSMATRDVVGEIVSRYQRDAAQPVATESAGGVDVAKRVQAGEAVDVVILSSHAIDKLIAEKTLLAGSRVDLVKSGIALAVQAGHLRPNIDSEEAVKNAVLAARTLSYSTGPSGVYLEKMFGRWGILEDIRGRIVVPPPGVPVGSLVANGTAELGFQQLSELLNLAGVDVVGPLPPAIQSITIFSGGVSAVCSDPAAARALLNFMASPAVASVKERYGMEAA